MALLAPGLDASELALARAGLAASGVAVREVSAAELPLVGAPAAEAAAQREAEAALVEAHDAFVATRFADARSIATTAEHRARRWGGAPAMARLLAELALVAAQSGDGEAVTRAAGFAPGLVLDAARYSPTVRQAFAAAQARLQALPRKDVEVRSDPSGATLFVDGQAQGRTPTHVALSAGPHAIALSLTGFATVAEELRGDLAGALDRPLTPLDEDARLAQLHTQLESRTEASPEALSLAAQRFSCDAAVALSGGRAWLAGPDLSATSSEADARALNDVTAALGRQLQAQCTLTHTPPEHARAGAPLRLEVKAGPCVARVHAALHLGPDVLSAPSAPVHDGVAQVTVAALPSSAKPSSLQYRLWGESAVGSRLSPLGSESAPLRVLIEPNQKPPRRWYQKWWVWTAVGGVLTVAAVATAVAVYRPPSEVRLVGQSTAP